MEFSAGEEFMESVLGVVLVAFTLYALFRAVKARYFSKDT